MSKMIILENVDAIVNSAGSVIAGNKNAFNTNEADGHSSSATEMMMIGGNNGGTTMHNYIDKLSFDGNVANNNFGTLSYGTCQSSSGSNGSTLMLCGGGAGPNYLDKGCQHTNELVFLLFV